MVVRVPFNLDLVAKLVSKKLKNKVRIKKAKFEFVRSLSSPSREITVFDG